MSGQVGGQIPGLKGYALFSNQINRKEVPFCLSEFERDHTSIIRTFNLVCVIQSGLPKRLSFITHKFLQFYEENVALGGLFLPVWAGRG